MEGGYGPDSSQVLKSAKSGTLGMVPALGVEPGGNLPQARTVSQGNYVLGAVGGNRSLSRRQQPNDSPSS